MKISVLSKDLGFWSQVPITVQRFDKIAYMDGPDDFEYEEELIWCNHAGATSEDIENEIINPNGADHVWLTKVSVCDKCDAFQRDNDEWWQDAPSEGDHGVLN